MKCSYHPLVDIQEVCNLCNKPLCSECVHKIKGKPYCQDCLVEGAEWAASVKNLKLPADAPKRAAVCALIPGMGAVYNNDYLKAITYFAVFASLVMMGDKINGVFGFGAFAFLVFNMFDAYRTAERKARQQIESGGFSEETVKEDKTIIGWGIFLIVLGVLFLLQNIIPYYFLGRLWPLVFILLGGYLIYRALRGREDRSRVLAGSILVPKKEDQ
jgi:hypothetical protein